MITAAILLLLVGIFGFTEASGVTEFQGTVIRMLYPEGTLVVEVEDPDISVEIVGKELVIKGAGAREIRLTPGRYTVVARKDGKLVNRELVSVTKNGREVVRVGLEPPPSSTQIPGSTGDRLAWEQSVAAMPASERMAAVIDRLKELNPGFDGAYDTAAHCDLILRSDALTDISPIRAWPELESFFVNSKNVRDLSALNGLPLTQLSFTCPRVTSLSPLEGMELVMLDLSGSTSLADLSPLKGMPLESLTIAFTQVSDLTPLTGMRLRYLNCEATEVSELSPLKGMPLSGLLIASTSVVDLSMLKDLPLTHLSCSGTQVDDVHLGQFKACQSLTTLSLVKTKVTGAGIDELKSALPNCQITWDGGVTEPTR